MPTVSGPVFATMGVNSGGQGIHANNIFRIGHMGYATPLDVLTALAVLEMDMKKYGQATKAAQLVMHA